MAIVTIVLAIELLILGLAGYEVTGAVHHTALIPAAIGVVFFILGLFSILVPKARKHFMHGAAMLGLLGFIGGAPGLLPLIQWIDGKTPDEPAAVIAKSIMSGLCLLFLIMCIESFKAARRLRKLQSS